MPDIKKLITAIVEPIIDYPEDLSIDVVDTDEFRQYHINLNPSDIGRVIGRKGRVVRAIRTIVYSVRTTDGKRSRIVINDEEDSDQD